MSELQIQLFGSPVIYLDQKPVSGFVSGKAAALIYYLAATNREQSRNVLAALFWADVPETRAKNSLRVILSNLRKLLGEHLTTSRKTVNLCISPHAVDSLHFSQLLANNGEAEGSLTPSHLRRAADLYKGEFLQGFHLADAPLFEEWVLIEREHFGQRILQVLNDLVSDALQNNSYQQGLDYALRSLALSSWQEEVHRSVMYLLALSGQRTQALAQYDICCNALEEEFGVPPSEETNQLYDQILANQIGPRSQVATHVLPPAISTDADGASQTYRSNRDWGDAPSNEFFWGREKEVAELTQIMAEDHCRIVAILGIGGQGKTALAAHLARSIEREFKLVIWRSVLNAPPLTQLLGTWLSFLSQHTLAQLPESLDEQLNLLVQLLKTQRCLLILDNLESIMDGGGRAGLYRQGYESYGQLIRRLGESEHNSCVILTSRERPREITGLARRFQHVHIYPLSGLAQNEAISMLRNCGISSPQEEQTALVERFSGNPLALLLVAETIQEIFDGDVPAFLSGESLVFDDIRDLLDQQFTRLSRVERDVMSWLAIERAPVTFETLESDMIIVDSQRALIEAVRSLQQRSLVDKREGGFSLQNVVTEYVTDVLIDVICGEVERGALAEEVNQPYHVHQSDLNRYALLKAQAKEYIRQSQTRLILHPITERLIAKLGRTSLDEQLKRILDHLRSETPSPGYAAGNILNLLLYINLNSRQKMELHEIDFSNLVIWQAALQDQELQKVNFARSDLSYASFTDTFSIIWSLAYSPNGKFLVMGTTSGALRLWNNITSQLVSTVQAHQGLVRTLAFSGNGQLLASGGEDGTICLWEVESLIAQGGEPGETPRLHELKLNAYPVSQVAFSPREDFLAAASFEGKVHLWRLDTSGEPLLLCSLSDHEKTVRSVAFHPSRPLLASGSGDKTIRLWDTNRLECVAILKEHCDLVRAVSFNADGTLLASCSDDKTIRLWDVTAVTQHDGNSMERHSHRTLRGHEQAVRNITFCARRRVFASCSEDHTIRLWDMRTGHIRRTLHGHVGRVEALACNPAGTTLASGGVDGTLRLWDIDSGEIMSTHQGYSVTIMSVALGPTSQTLVSGDHLARLWDLTSGECTHVLTGHDSFIWQVAYSQDGNHIATASEDQTVRIWNARTGVELDTLRGHHAPVYTVAFGQRSKVVASGDIHSRVKLWPWGDSRKAVTFEDATDIIWDLAFSPDEAWLAAACEDNKIYVWDLQKEALHCVLKAHAEPVRSIAFSPAGGLLASGGRDRMIYLWDLRSGELVKRFEGHSDAVQSLTFGPNGTQLISASYDQTIRVWDSNSGQLILSFVAHGNQIRSIDISLDGTTLISGSDDGTIKLWDLTRVDAPDPQSAVACLQTLKVPGPYDGMNITDVTGITPTQREALKDLGAVEVPAAG